MNPGAFATDGLNLAGVDVPIELVCAQRHLHGHVACGALSASGWDGAPPKIRRITPDHGSIDGGTLVEIVGSGFHPKAQVSIGAFEVLATVTSGRITCATPPGGLYELGNVVVTVANPDGQVARGRFRYELDLDHVEAAAE